LFISLQDFIILPTDKFRRCVIFLLTSSPMNYVRRLTLCRWFPIPLLYRSEKKPFADGFTDGIWAPKKRFPLEIYRRIFIPSVILWLTNKKYLSVNPSVSVWNTNRIYPSVNLLVLVVATVKCRRINSVGKSVGECLKYRLNSSVGKILGNSFFLNFFLKNYLGYII